MPIKNINFEYFRHGRLPAGSVVLYVVTLTPHKSLANKVVLVSIYQPGDRGTGRVCNLPKVTQLVRDGV